MYDTSARVLAPINNTGTNENVGPSTYVLCNPRSRKQNCAPFLSDQARESTFITKFYTDALYDVRSALGYSIKGGASMKNKAPRFVYKTDDDVPPPTKYCPLPPQFRKKKLKLDPTKPKLYVCPVPHSVTCVPPTIPTKIDENGYDIDPDGNLIKIPADEPEFLDINIEATVPGKKGWKWSCRTSDRFSTKYESFGPGPAAYSVQVPKCRRTEEEELVREMARRLSYVPRYIDAQQDKTVREGLPGPGHYDFPRPPSDRAKSIHPRPFICKAGRFKGGTVSDSPPPNKYKICDCYRVQRQFSVKCAPFGVDAPRFKRKKVEVTPGPGDYEIKSAVREKLESKKNPFALYEPPFNTTQERRSLFVARDAAWTPSPADYPVEEEESEEETTEIYSSVFMSIVERFGSVKEDGVSPARYDVTESFKKILSRKSFSTAKLPFNSSGPRSTTPAAKTGVPCPTSYRNERGLADSGYHFCHSPRWREDEEEKPGPGTYHIHPGCEVATYKAWDTHNLKLKENVLRKKLRLAPRETRKQWRRQMKRRKLLKWFDVGLDYEERMALLINKLFADPV